MSPYELDHDGFPRSRPDAPPGLFLSRHGVWYHDGDRVRHGGLEALLHRSVARGLRGDLVVTTGRDVLPFLAEDAPVMVRTVSHNNHDLLLALTDGTAEAVAQRTFYIDDSGRVRVPVRGRTFWALLSRTATQLLLGLVDDSARVRTPRGPAPIETLAAPCLWSAAPTDMARPHELP